MNFVQGKVCHTCNKFVINNMTHLCCPSISSNVLIHNETNSKVENNAKAIENVSKEDQIKLIEIIETCRPLWNHRLSLGERSEAVKSNLWNKIYVQFDGKYSILGIQKSWKYIKERYSREKKLPPSGSMGGKREWSLLKNLAFLDEVSVTHKRTTESFDLGGEGNETNNKSVEPEQSKKQKKSVIADNMSMLLNEIKNSKPIPPTAPEPLDDDERFGSYLVGLMKNLPNRQKIIIQGKIITMVINEIE